jgi:hypothetical protein
VRRAPSSSPDPGPALPTVTPAGSGPAGLRSSAHRRRRVVARAVCVGLFAVPLLACRADVRVQVALTPAGSGSVAASLVLDRQAVVVAGGSVDVGDLRRDGWTVAGPTGAPDGSETVTVSHAFANADQAAALLGRLGPAFRLTVTHHHAAASSSVGLSGSVDLRGGIDTLAGAPGSPGAAGGLAGALAAVARAGGTVPTVSAAVVARMPSRPKRVLGGGTVAGDTVTWTVPVGTSAAIGATSVRTDTTARRWLEAAAALVVALVVVVAVQAVVAGRRTRR